MHNNQDMTKKKIQTFGPKVKQIDGECCYCKASSLQWHKSQNGFGENILVREPFAESNHSFCSKFLQKFCTPVCKQIILAKTDLHLLTSISIIKGKSRFPNLNSAIFVLPTMTIHMGSWKQCDNMYPNSKVNVNELHWCNAYGITTKWNNRLFTSENLFNLHYQLCKYIHAWRSRFMSYSRTYTKN